MACVAGSQNKDGMGGFVGALGCRKGAGMLPQFLVGHAGKKHVRLPLCGREGADGIPQNTQIRLAKISNEVGGGFFIHGDRVEE